MLYSSSWFPAAGLDPSSSESAPGYTVSQISGINMTLTGTDKHYRENIYHPIHLQIPRLVQIQMDHQRRGLKGRNKATYNLLSYNVKLEKQEGLCCFHSPALFTGKAGVSHTGEMGAGTCETETAAAGRTGDKGLGGFSALTACWDKNGLLN